ncbi:OLC1v1004782C1 [Oldenlandia corymbosa var. corymbosa]|uniref:OLC1v1004782C1 n=1 Tax=Oldenlandia corymbosa var. corymbosa TaxID=529605 RepID=A0AAV1DF49_OLDCO|nr:OLC1v1004782C1 [Oldenlandia corymbosa var. corymbosa]
MFLLLASHSVVKCTVVYDDNKGVKRLYGLTPLSRCFLPDEHGNSRAPPLAFLRHSAYIHTWKKLKDAVLEGGSPFERANNGLNLFEYGAEDPRFGMIFDEAMQSTSTNFMIEILQSYKGFENVKVLVVGGGFGATLDMIISKYPSIKGINFDVPHVLKSAPTRPGIEHVEGNMFEWVPKGDAMVIKRVLHDWSDEIATKILKNCFQALPDSGKVIVIEVIVPESPEGLSSLSRLALTHDMKIFSFTPNGKARTEKQFDDLAKSAGFAASKVACRTLEYCVLELYKT